MTRIYATTMAIFVLSSLALASWFYVQSCGVLEWFGFKSSSQMASLFDYLRLLQWFNYSVGLIAVVYFLTFIVSIMLFKKRIVRARLQVCPTCGYDLSNRVDEAPCSECGQHISRRELVRMWCRALH